MPTQIDWADETINPLGWGCYGPGGTPEHPKYCWYCYAHRMAKRGLRACPECKAFVPHWHPDALGVIETWKRPRRVFIQSMGDLFGSYVPRAHIWETLEMARVFPQHTFIFLTKEPWNLANFNPFPDNAWVGMSATDISQIGGIPILGDVQAKVRFVSFEPMLDYTPPDLRWVSWVIIGAMTGPGRKLPQRVWVDDLIAEAARFHLPVFLKENLLKLFPDLPKRQEFPNA
jgi:protein gp37